MNGYLSRTVIRSIYEHAGQSEHHKMLMNYLKVVSAVVVVPHSERVVECEESHERTLVSHHEFVAAAERWCLEVAEAVADYTDSGPLDS